MFTVLLGEESTDVVPVEDFPFSWPVFEAGTYGGAPNLFNKPIFIASVSFSPDWAYNVWGDIMVARLESLLGESKSGHSL